MLYFPKWKIAVVLIVLLVGTILAIPSLMPRATLDQMPSWFPRQTVSLGLDLQGGSHLLLEVDMQSLIRERLDGVLDETRTTLRNAKIGYTNLAVTGNGVSLTLPDDASVERAQEELRKVVAEGMELSADGTKLNVGFSEAGLTQLKQRTVEQSIEVVRRRIDETGTREPTIIRQGEDRIVVQVPGVSDPQEIKRILQSEAKLTFQMVEESAMGAATPPPGVVMVEHADPQDGPPLPLQKRILVAGENLTD